MNTIHRGLDITCKDSTKMYNLMCSDYDESIDEVKIRTCIKENELCRGWIGDLRYKTRNSREIVTGDDTEFIAEDTYKDVLLKSVKIWSTDDGIVTWEYTFLKK